MKKRFETVQRVEYIKKTCRGKKVLHLGCTNYPYTQVMLDSDALLHLELEKVAATLYGFDFDQKGIDILSGLGVKNLFRADLEKLDELDLNETFDVIIAGEIIEHLSNPGLFLKGIRRFMNDETILVVTTINAYCAMRFFIYGARGRGGVNEPVHQDHVAYYSYKTLNLILERENLGLKEFVFYDLGAEHRPFSKWYYNFVNDVCVKISPQLSDGVIAVCKLKPEIDGSYLK